MTKYYFSRKNIFRQIIIGAILVSIGSALLFNTRNIDMLIGLSSDQMDIAISFAILVGFLIAPIFWGCIFVLRNVLRLLTNKPQVTIAESGIFLAEYSAWKIIPWSAIIQINEGAMHSRILFKSEQCLIITFSQKYADIFFSKNALIKTEYLNCSRAELTESILVHWQQYK